MKGKKQKVILDQKIHPAIASPEVHPDMITNWKALSDDNRKEAINGTFIWMMSDFLFGSSSLTSDWLCYLEQEGLLKIITKRGDMVMLENKELKDSHIIGIKMLFKAFAVAKNLINNRKDLSGLIQYVLQIEYPSVRAERAVNLARDQEQIEKISNSLLEIAKEYPIDAKPTDGMDMNLHHFVKSYNRRLVVAVLVGRAIGMIICKIGQTGDMKQVEEMKKVFCESESGTVFRNEGNLKFKSQNYVQALISYNIAVTRSKYSALSYCNRSHTAFLMKNYRLAICDGYRVVALKPDWTKGYYRLAEALKANDNVKEALIWIQKGLEMSSDVVENEEMVKLRDAYAIELQNIQQQSLETLIPEPSTSKKTKKSKKSKKKNKPLDSNQQEQIGNVPDLVSDCDSMKEISDNEVDVRDFFRKSSNETARRLATMRLEALEKDKNMLQEKSTIKEKTKPSRKPKNAQKNDLFDETKKNSNKVKSENDSFSLYMAYRGNGSKAAINKDYATAIFQYDLALEYLENFYPKKITLADRFNLLFARAYVGMETRNVVAVARSLDFMSLLIGEDCKAIIHPILYYEIAFGQYLLNNYLLMSHPLNLGLNMLEKNTIKPLKWPGFDVNIPESEPEKLKQLIHDMQRIPRNPPRPDATCFYLKCGRDDKQQGVRSYLLCDKEFQRRDIYASDYNFEGYMKLICSWDCVMYFHFKCWSRFKHDNFKKTGDKDVLDSACFTDGCKGTICRIIMIDEKQEIKKDTVSNKTKEKEETKNPGNSRMSKNERNLTKRRKKLEEAKNKKLLMKQTNAKVDDEEEMDKSKPEKAKLAKTYTDDDIAIVLKRNTGETSHQSTKSKTNKSRSKKRANSVSLNKFLKDFRSHFDKPNVEEAILNSLDPEMPFRIPDDLRDEIEQFESKLSDEEQFWTCCLYEYFENFFEANGPVKVQDDLLLQQQLLIPEKMRKIIDRHSDIISFLLKNQQRFLIVAPYIGLPSQETEIIRLADEFQNSLKPKKQTVLPQVSLLDTLDCDFDSPSTLSDFARDLYNVGEVPLSEVQNITGVNHSDEMGLDSFDAPFVLPTNGSRNMNNHKGSGDGLDSLCLSIDSFLNNEQNLGNNIDASSLVDARTLSNTDTSYAPSFEGENEKITPTFFHSATQTEVPTEYEEKIQALLSENADLKLKLQESNEKFDQFSTASKIQLENKTKELDQSKDALLSSQKKAAEANEKAQTELQKITIERSTWEQSLKLTNTKLIEAQSKQREQAELIQELEQKLKSKEDDYDKLSQLLQSQRSTWLEEKARTDRDKDNLNTQLKQANAQLIETELKVLEKEKSYALKILKKAKEECEQIVTDLEKLIRNYSNNPPAQAEVMKGYRKWKNNVDTCSLYIEQTKQHFHTNAELLRNGKRLSDLTQFRSLNPPPPGPSIQQVASLAMRAASMSAHSLASNSFSNHLSNNANTLIKNGVSEIPLAAASRSIQAPIGTAKQLTVPLPSTSPLPIVTPEQPAPSSQPKGSFEKIMIQLQLLYPNISRPDLALCIKEVRQNNNNSLAGLSLDEIVKQASAIVTIKSSKSKPPVSQTNISNIPLTSNSWLLKNARGRASSGSPANLLGFVEEDPCVICHDPLSSMEIHKLQCGHVFHEKCLSQWLKRDRTCPTCRDFAIDTKEFPTLGSANRH